MEVDFLKLNQPMPGTAPKLKATPGVGVKNINLIRAPKRGLGGFAEIAHWNTSARQGAFNETRRGWMAKPQRNNQNHGIRRACAGFRALREIRFYQKLTCFLIPMRAFQCVARQVALDVALNGTKY